MTDKPREVGLSSVGPVLAFTAAELDHDVLVRFDEGTIWLTQALMTDLFGVDVRSVNEHLQNISSSGELRQLSGISG